MTTVGHSLFGVAVGVAAMPVKWTPAKKIALLSLFVGLSNVPDWPLPLWGHRRYDISHSIFANASLAALCVAAMLSWRRGREYMGGAAVVISGGMTWLSHLLLDTFYNHGHGLAAFWPLSDARLSLALPWFETLSAGGEFGHHAGRIFSIEAAFFGTLVVVSAVSRQAVLRLRRVSKPSKI